MTTISVEQIRPGAVITTYKSRGLFKGSDVSESIVVGKARDGRVPVGITNTPGRKALYYASIPLDTLEEVTSAKGTKVTERDLSIEEANILRLWNFEELWDGDGNKISRLKEGINLWVIFDNDGKITELTTTKPEDLISKFQFNYGSNGKVNIEGPEAAKYPPLQMTVTNNHLYHIMNNSTPGTIYYQLEVLNWLVMQMSEKARHSINLV